MLDENYWRRQRFKLLYILFITFGMPALVIGFYALFLAISEPGKLFPNRGKAATQPVDPLESPTFFVRQDALRKLAKGPADRSRRDIVEKVKPLLRDHNFQIQDTAIDVLGNWGSPEDVPALAELARDQSGTFVRPRICTALGKIGGESSCEVLVDILGMGNTEREHAIRALTQCGPIAEEVLLRRGATADPAQKRVICVALERLGTAKSIGFLTTESANTDPVISAAAKQALEKVKP